MSSLESPAAPRRPPIAPAVSFLLILAGLAAVALLGLLWKPALVEGLPNDPDARAASDLVRGRVRVLDPMLRTSSALLGDGTVGEAYSAATRATVADAESRIDAARKRLPRDPRLIAARAHLALVRRDMVRAERGFRAAIGRAEGYGEARLGLAVTLALRAQATSDALTRRKLELEAIGQLAAVSERDSCYAVALYDRAVLLERVGRTHEAQRFAAEYLKRDGTSVYAERLWALGLGGMPPDAAPRREN